MPFPERIGIIQKLRKFAEKVPRYFHFGRGISTVQS